MSPRKQRPPSTSDAAIQWFASAERIWIATLLSVVRDDVFGRFNWPEINNGATLGSCPALTLDGSENTKTGSGPQMSPREQKAAADFTLTARDARGWKIPKYSYILVTGINAGMPFKQDDFLPADCHPGSMML